MRALIPAIVVLSIVAASPVNGQEFDLRGAGIPGDVATRIQRILEDSRTKRLEGVASIGQGAVSDGSVVASNGSITVAGTIHGDLIALRADVVFEPGAIVDGDVTVIAGMMQGEDDARIGGTVTVFGEGFDLWDEARRFHGDRSWRDRDWRTRSDHEGADLLVRVGWNYNRVEGLPVQFGPDIGTGGPYATRVRALAVWRTAVGPITRTEPMGYEAQIEQNLHGSALRVGASVRSTIDPIEAWSLSNLEASLAAALFHDDQRDYYERRGWSVYTRVAPANTPLEMRLEYRDEEHRSVAARDPWTLFNGDREWRKQPFVGEGDVRLLAGTVAWDPGQSGEAFDRPGWYGRAHVVHGLEGTLIVPGGVTLTDEIMPDISYDGSFTSGLIDVRRYAGAGPGGILGMRVVAGGNLRRAALPPQFQHALGGAGTLPGYALFSGDCGARGAPVTARDDAQGAAFFAGYGCDRFALAQIEYRGGFSVRWGHPVGRWAEEDEDWRIDADVDWTVFFDAARGWAFERERFPGRTGTGVLYDAGAGVILGGLGIYGAVPLNGHDRGVRLFVRLGPRF